MNTIIEPPHYSAIRAALRRVASNRNRNAMQAGRNLIEGIRPATIATLTDMENRDRERREREIKVRQVAMDDSIRDSDKIEATVSPLELREEMEGNGWEGSSVLTKAERIRLAREVAPFRAFRSAVASMPLALMA